MTPNPLLILLTVLNNSLLSHKIKTKLCQDLTEPDQRDKDPEPAGNWVNAVTKMKMYPDRNPKWEWALEEGWDEVLERQPEGLLNEEQAEEPEEAQAGMDGRISCPEFIN